MSIFSKFSKLLRPLKQSVGKTVHKAFTEYLLMTNIVSSVILMQIGDWIQQEIEYQTGTLAQRYDYGRMFRMATTGIGYGVLHHYFYTNLDKVWPNPTVNHTIKKVAADQFSMSPFCIVYFFYCAGILEGKNIYECTDELKEKFLNVYLLDCVVWPPSQYFNFLYVPVKYQVIYINVVTMFYDIFLSYIKHKEPDKIEVEDNEDQEHEGKHKSRIRDKDSFREDAKEDKKKAKKEKKVKIKKGEEDETEEGGELKRGKSSSGDLKREKSSSGDLKREKSSSGDLKKGKSDSVMDYKRKGKEKTEATEKSPD